MLTDAAIEPGPRRLVQPAAALRLGGALARRPRRVARRVGALGAELGRIAAGSSDIAPRKGDRRFGDRAWNDSWVFHRLMQAYLALGGTVAGLVDDAALDWRTDLRIRFVLDNLLDALAPTNFALTNPQVLKETIDRGGENLVTGALRFARDAGRGRLPAMVDTSGFQVGRNLGVSEGSVVAHTDVFELIHYRPTTTEVYETPLLIVPADDQQVLRHGPRARTQPDRAPGRPGPPGLLHLLAQSRRRAQPLRLRHLRAGHLRGPRRGRRDRAPRRRQRARGLLGRDHHRRGCSAISPRRAGSARSRA